MSVRSKAVRALVAHLKAAGVLGAIYPDWYSGDRVFPSTTVYVTRSPEDPAYTGSFAFNVGIESQYFAAQPSDELNPEAHRVAFDALTTAIEEALMLSDDNATYKATCKAINAAALALSLPADDSAESVQVAANNADLAAFTAQWWGNLAQDGGHADDGAATWKSQFWGRLIACGTGGLLE